MSARYQRLLWLWGGLLVVLMILLFMNKGFMPADGFPQRCAVWSNSIR